MSPSIALSKLVQYIKERSSQKLFQEFEQLRKRYWDSTCGQFAVTVGNVNAADVQKYIEEQGTYQKHNDFNISEF